MLATTLELLGEVGYEQLSVELVASRAGVGKATIYRRYRGKAALVAAAVDRRTVRVPPDTRTDTPRDAVLSLSRWLTQQIAEQAVGLLDATFAGMRHDPELAAEMRRVRRRDELAMTEHLDPIAAEVFVEIAPPLIVHRLLVLGESCDEDYLTHLIDDVIVPLMSRRV